MSDHAAGDGDHHHRRRPMVEKPDDPLLKRKCRYNSPVTQVSLIGLVCFCCPGMFNALSGMGGGGQLDHSAANNANTALYTTFALFGILGGPIYNLLGPRLTLSSGCFSYALYAASFLRYNHSPHDQSFVIAAGAVLGAGAGLLWAGQGAIMTSYPLAGHKGAYISLFWCIFNLGGVAGGLIPFFLNYSRVRAASVNDATYLAFMAFMGFGAILSLAILPPDRVVRDDGSRPVAVEYYPDLRTELRETRKLFTDWRMVAILIPAWASNFFYSYQFNNVNGLLFTLRTRGLNNIFYWAAQMMGSAVIGQLLDSGLGFTAKSRRRRGLVGVAAVAAIGTVIWAGGLVNQMGYSWEKLPKVRIDFKESSLRFAGPFVLYFCYGLLDAMFQSLCYWVIGALADDSQTLSRYSGLYKGVQSAGAAVAWQIDAHKTPLLTQLIVNWLLTTISYPLLALLILFGVKDVEEEGKLDDDEETNSRSLPRAANSFNRSSFKHAPVSMATQAANSSSSSTSPHQINTSLEEYLMTLKL